MKKRAHYLQHVPFEGLGSIEAWFQDNNYAISCTRFFENPVLPKVEEIDFLVIMGGPMSVNDEQELPWLVTEKQFVKKVIQAGKPVLGICLGAQLIANTLGARVFANDAKEIGWFPIYSVPAPEHCFSFPQATEVFHWHGETFNLPAEAQLLASSAACKHQAFQIGLHVIGLQFHMETTPASAQALVKNCRDELITGEFVQSETQILAAPLTQYQSINTLMARLLDYLHKRAT